jgi:uncharacterized cupredoxin-like copper-binding protein
MAIYSAQHTLSETVATLVVPPSTQPQEVHLHNMTKSSNEYIHLGNSEITLTNSMHIDPGESVEITLMSGQELYALSDPAGLTLGVLAVRHD